MPTAQTRLDFSLAIHSIVTGSGDPWNDGRASLQFRPSATFHRGFSMFVPEPNCRPGLSVIVPALNEAGRLPAYLGRVVSYLESVSVHYEVIVVDDGSTDGLADAISRWRSKAVKCVC